MHYKQEGRKEDKEVLSSSPLSSQSVPSEEMDTVVI